MKSKTKKDQTPPPKTVAKTVKTTALKTTPKAAVKTTKQASPVKKVASKTAVSKVTTPKTATPKTTISKVTKPKAATAVTTPKLLPPKSPSTIFHPYDPYPLKVGEVYMDSKQLTHFRAILDHWKRALMQEVDHTITEMKEASVTLLADPNDRATQEETFNLELRTRDRERKLIRKIEEALKRIDAKDYGHCELCGVEIGIRRLEARPTAVLCIDCKTLDEIREKRTAQ